MTRVKKTVLERFESAFVKSDGCWLWQKSTFKDGYGQFAIKPRNFRAHRFSFELYVSKIPDGMCVCHRCDTPGCVNPAHLFLGSQQDNTADRVAKGRTAKHFGRLHGSAKLFEADIHEIREARETYLKIGEKYGISQSLVCNIKKFKRWQHVPVRAE